MKKKFKTLFVSMTILLVMLAVIELFLRLLGFRQQGNSFLEKDTVLHHIHRKNYTFNVQSFEGEEQGSHTVKYDQFRRRVSENSLKSMKDNDIWFLGDSFTESNELSWENTYAGKIDISTQYRTVNFGVKSYSPLLYFIQLRKELQSISKKPEIVYIQLYSNDVSDDDHYAVSAEFDYSDRPVKCNGGSKLLYNIYTRLVLLNETERAIRRMFYFFNKRSASSANARIFNNYNELAPDINSNGRFGKSILQINSLLDSLAIKHYFFAIPSKYSCLSKDWTSPTFPSNFTHFMTENKFPFINLDSVFQKSSQPEGLFYKDDIHCTTAGNDLIAREILKTLKD
jgi:hypothetical protein